jgi:uncharacterized protein (DUF2249 family)
MSAGINKSLKGGKNGRHWETLVDYNLDELKVHLERNFTEGMTWDNYGLGPERWNIDHIVARSRFEYKTAEDPEFYLCWTLHNLRPCWSLENTIKSNKIVNVKSLKRRLIVKRRKEV